MYLVNEHTVLWGFFTPHNTGLNSCGFWHIQDGNNSTAMGNNDTDFYLYITNFSFQGNMLVIGNQLQEPGLVVEIIYLT